MKIATVVGARPQFIKAGPVSRAIAERPGLDEVLVYTGQHHDSNMAGVFFEELELPPPAHALGIHGGSHGAMTGRMLAAIETVLLEESVDVVIVYGDTNSTLAGALAASKLHIPVAHVEAGLRSFNRRMPEEINRVVTDHLSHILLCPTPTAVTNLSAEGITSGVHHVGDVMYDASLHAAVQASRSDVLERLGLEPRAYIVATLHRAETTDRRQSLESALRYLDGLDLPVVLPLHPRTADRLRAFGMDPHRLGRVRVTTPLGYLDMTRLVADASLVATDSGGLQKEAYFHRVPCITLRSETEWVETVEAGWNRLWSEAEWAPRRDIDAYGDGDSAASILTVLEETLA